MHNCLVVIAMAFNRPGMRISVKVASHAAISANRLVGWRFILIRRDSISSQIRKSPRIPSQHVTVGIHANRKPDAVNTMRSPEVPFDRMTESVHDIPHRKFDASDRCAGSHLFCEDRRHEFSTLLSARA